MHAPEQTPEDQPDTTMLSVVPGSFPVTPDAPRTTMEPIMHPQAERNRTSNVQGFVPNLPGYQGLSVAQWNSREDSHDTWRNPLNIPETGLAVNPPMFSPTNPFAQHSIQGSERTNYDQDQTNALNNPPSTTQTPTSLSDSGRVGDQTMQIHDHIPIPPPVPRIHCYNRASPDPIIFNLPEAGNVAAAAQRAYPRTAEPWAQLETWIHTAMSQLGQYLEVNFHEMFRQIDSI